MFKRNVISKRTFVFHEILTPWNCYAFTVNISVPVDYNIMIFWYLLLLMRRAIDSFSCFWKSLTLIFDPMGDLTQNGSPAFGTLGTKFELLVGTSKLRILSKGDINWET